MAGEESEGDIARRLYRDYASSKSGNEMPSSLQSRAFKMFSKHKTKANLLYESLATIAGKLYLPKIEASKKEEIDNIFQSYNFMTTAEEEASFALWSFVFLAFVGIICLPISIILGVSVLLGAMGSYFYFASYHAHIKKTRKNHAGTELIMSVLYIVIYMRNVSNLEAAVRFAAENLEGPLSVDYAKLLWDVSVKRYASIQEALNEYIQQWKDYNDSYIDAIYMIETSLVQKSDDRRIELLDQALKRILDGTFETMVHYVNDLRTPVNAVFMLGITLPIMGLVMLPLIGSFMANLLTSTTLFVFYDVLLPVGVVLLIGQILSTRPAAFPEIDLSNHPLLPPPFYFNFFGKPAPAYVPAILVTIFLATPYLWYAVVMQTATPSELDVVFSLFLTLALGAGIAVFCRLSSHDAIKLQKEIKEVEDDFAYAVFQIGNRLSEGVPAEVAMIKTAQTMKDTNISYFIKVIVNNIQKLGFDLKRAIFDETYGAMIYYPSTLIRSVMRIFVESVKESEEVASTSLTHIGTYLQAVHRIEEKIKDVLSETLSSVKFQSAFIGPLISGIIVGLTSMILIILSVLGDKIAALNATASSAGPGSGMGGAMAFGFFQMSNTIPLYVFQIVVGIYLVEIIVISTYLASKIEHGDSLVQMLDSTQRALLIGITVYFIITMAVTIGFSGLARIAISIGEF